MGVVKINRRNALLGAAALALPAVWSRKAASAITLRVWTFLDPVNGKTARDVVLRKLIGSFEEKNPGVKIVVEPQNWQVLSEKFLAAHQTGTAPDIPILIANRLHGAISSGALANLYDYFVKDWSKEEIADIDSPIWRFASSPKERYHLSISTQMWATIYRADLMREAKIDPASLTTWDKFIEASKRLMKKDADGSVVRWGIGQTNAGLTPNGPFLLSMLLDAQGTVLDEKYRAKWATPAGVRGLELSADMIRKHKVMPESAINMDNEQVVDAFNSGRIAFFRYSTARWLQHAKIFGDGSIDYMPSPSFEEGKHSPGEVLAWCASVWSGSKNKELAAKFVEHMATKEADRMWSVEAGQVPNRASTVAENKSHFSDPKNIILQHCADDIRQRGWLPPAAAGEGGWNEGFCNALQDVIIRKAQPLAALQKAESAFNRMYRR